MSATTEIATRVVSAFKTAPRLQQSLTAAVEKKALLWMAVRTPGWISSDHLTLLGFLAQFLAGVGYTLAGWNKQFLWLATFFIALNWLGDSLDGTLARFRNQERPRYGFYVDHMADTFGAVFLMGGLALSGFLHWQVAAGMLVGFLILSIESYLTTYTIGKFRMSYALFGPTEIRILLMIGNVALLYRPYAHLFGHRFLLFDVGGVIAIAGMMSMAIIATAVHTVQLYREERIS
ncbi:MAG TPA: CDP-alcohol phosphatidyltransferase family protein [Candidatus Eisenbacteria bacterium]|nr:CDP-alcohol phosphatidyltransferase family protein [Candidatus Eisenbacteria bacterium]